MYTESDELSHAVFAPGNVALGNILPLRLTPAPARFPAKDPSLGSLPSPTGRIFLGGKLYYDIFVGLHCFLKFYF